MSVNDEHSLILGCVKFWFCNEIRNEKKKQPVKHNIFSEFHSTKLPNMFLSHLEAFLRFWVEILNNTIYTDREMGY